MELNLLLTTHLSFPNVATNHSEYPELCQQLRFLPWTYKNPPTIAIPAFAVSHRSHSPVNMPDNRPPAGRQLLISRAIFSGGDPSQMLNKDQRRNDAHVQARQEEARLLGARDYKYVVGSGDGGVMNLH